MKEREYDWWVKRIRKNLQWYDQLRLDHFRAFAAYWPYLLKKIPQ